MVIKQTNFNLVYPRVHDFKKKFILAEEELGQDFLESTILPVPEQVQEEVPRVIAQTKNGHSVLNIALSVASFMTNYDGEFTKEWKNCEEYLNIRCSSIYNLIENMTKEKNTFVGLITNVEVDELPNDGLDVLIKCLFDNNASKLGNIHDISCKFAYVYKERYYINITLENLREYELRQLSMQKLIINKQIKHTIGVTIDVNDRYAASKYPDYLSTKESFEEILKITDHILNDKLNTLIMKGEFSLE